MKKFLLIVALLAATTAMAGEPWQNGFSVGVEGNFSITNSDNSNLNNAEAFNDFKGTAISGSYTAFLAKGLFGNCMQNHNFFHTKYTLPSNSPYF